MKFIFSVINTSPSSFWQPNKEIRASSAKQNLDPIKGGKTKILCNKTQTLNPRGNILNNDEFPNSVFSRGVLVKISSMSKTKKCQSGLLTGAEKMGSFSKFDWGLESEEEHGRLKI